MATQADLVVRLGMDARGFNRTAGDAMKSNRRLAQAIIQSQVPATERLAAADKRLNQLRRAGLLTAEQFRIESIRLADAHRAAAQGAQFAAKSTARLGQQSFRSQQVLTQLAFAAEDASVSFGTGGMAGAIRGASNNLVLIAATMAGTAGAIAAVSLVVITQLVPAFAKLAKGAKTARKEVDDFRDATEVLAEQRTRQGERKASGIEFKKELRSVEQLSTLTEARKSLEESESQLAKLRAKESPALENLRFARPLTRGDARAAEEAGFPLFFDPDDIDNIRTSEKQLKRLQEAEQKVEKIQRGISQELERQEAIQERILELEQKRARENGRALRNFAFQVKAAAKSGFQALRDELEKRQKRFTDLQTTLRIQAEPDELQRSRQQVFANLRQTLDKIAQLQFRTPQEIAGLQDLAKRGAARRLAELEPAATSTGPVEAATRGSREALMTALRGQFEGKEDPKESTQKKIEKHLASINKALKNNPNAFELGAFD